MIELGVGDYMASLFKQRYAVSRTSSDRWPVIFRPDCERTLPNWPDNPDGEGYLEMREKLNNAGYDLLDELPYWAKVWPHKRPGDEY